jgi:YD repeat-containing protein
MSSGGRTATYGYDADNRLASVARPDLGTFTFGYDFDGRLTSLSRPNGVTSTNTYDTAGLHHPANSAARAAILGSTR